MQYHTRGIVVLPDAMTGVSLLLCKTYANSALVHLAAVITSRLSFLFVSTPGPKEDKLEFENAPAVVM